MQTCIIYNAFQCNISIMASHIIGNSAVCSTIFPSPATRDYRIHLWLYPSLKKKTFSWILDEKNFFNGNRRFWGPIIHSFLSTTWFFSSCMMKYLFMRARIVVSNSRHVIFYVCSLRLIWNYRSKSYIVNDYIRMKKCMEQSAGTVLRKESHI